MQEGEQLLQIVEESPLLLTILRRLRGRTSPEIWLGAGAVVQAVWNHRFGFPHDYGIDDIDLVWFDPADLTEKGEAAVAGSLSSALRDLPFLIDAKNQARVHQWYKRRFGFAIEPITSMDDALTRWPAVATAIALRDNGESVDIVAPFGLADLLAGVVRPNKRQISREIYEAKVVKWRRKWPDLEVLGW